MGPSTPPRFSSPLHGLPGLHTGVAAIEDSLTTCSLQAAETAAAPDLSSDAPLPRRREQLFLDAQQSTGEVCCSTVDYAGGTKAGEGPCPAPSSRSGGEEPSGGAIEDSEEEAAAASSSDAGFSSSSGEGTACFSLSSAVTCGTTSESESCDSDSDGAGDGAAVQRKRCGRGSIGSGGGSVLVLVGCRRCMAYFMVEKAAAECPGCRSCSDLVHFGVAGGA